VLEALIGFSLVAGAVNGVARFFSDMEKSPTLPPHTPWKARERFSYSGSVWPSSQALTTPPTAARAGLSTLVVSGGSAEMPPPRFRLLPFYGGDPQTHTTMQISHPSTLLSSSS
jgi:hypothetical protein